MLVESLENKKQINPQISVIVPIYKAEKYIVRCVESILAQRFENFELILIDDGSPDNCPTICDEYAALYERIKVIHKENGGVSSARNIGIKHAQAEYIAFIDSDDYILEDYLEKLYVEDSDLCVGGYNLVNETDTILESNVITARKYLNKKDIEYGKVYSTNIMYSSWGKLFRKSIISNNNLLFDIEKTLGEDTLFVIQYLQYVESLSLIEYAGYMYSVSENNNTLSGQIRMDILEDLVASRECSLKVAKLLSDELVDVINKNTLINVAWYIEILLASNMRYENKEKMLNHFLENEYVKKTIEEADKYYYSPKTISSISMKSAKKILCRYEILAKKENLIKLKNRLIKKMKNRLYIH